MITNSQEKLQEQQSSDNGQHIETFLHNGKQPLFHAGVIGTFQHFERENPLEDRWLSARYRWEFIHPYRGMAFDPLVLPFFGQFCAQKREKNLLSRDSLLPMYGLKCTGLVRG